MRTMPCASSVYAAPAPSPRIANWTAWATGHLRWSPAPRAPVTRRLLDVLRDVDRLLVGDDLFPVEPRHVDVVVRARLEHAEPRRGRCPRRRQAEQVDVLRALQCLHHGLGRELGETFRDVHERE